MWAHSGVVEYGYCRDENCECSSIICDSWVEGSFNLPALTTVVSYPCTVFEENGKEVIMMMDITSYFIIENTACTGEQCDWAVTNTYPHQIPISQFSNTDPWNFNMVTLDNVPYFFYQDSISLQY